MTLLSYRVGLIDRRETSDAEHLHMPQAMGVSVSEGLGWQAYCHQKSTG